MVPGPSTSSRSPGSSAAACTARSALPPGSTIAPSASSTDVGQRLQGPYGHRQLLGERARPAVADADLVAVGAQVLAAARAPVAVPAAEHRVAGDPGAEPALVDALADAGDRAGPLVADPHRVARLAGVQVGHVAGEELHVGAAHARAFDVDDDLARRSGSGRGTSSTSACRGPVMTNARMDVPSGAEMDNDMRTRYGREAWRGRLCGHGAGRWEHLHGALTSGRPGPSPRPPPRPGRGADSAARSRSDSTKSPISRFCLSRTGSLDLTTMALPTSSSHRRTTCAGVRECLSASAFTTGWLSRSVPGASGLQAWVTMP